MMTRSCWICIFSSLIFCSSALAQRARDHGIIIGVLKPGENNAITDVRGVRVGHATLIEGERVRTGVTSIVPHGENIFQDKVACGIFVGNGFGKLAGSTQVRELGTLETPIVLTNTLSVPTGMEGLIEYTLQMTGNEKAQSVNAVVGETNDGFLNDIRGRHVQKQHVLSAIKNARNGKVDEGNVGAGTGTVCFGFKGGIGTASRVLPKKLGSYTIGVLVQTNFGGVLQIDGVPVGEALGRYYLKDHVDSPADGSCMIVIATDAPIDARNLERMAKRSIMGLAKTGGIASNGSGDYAIAFSTAKEMRTPHASNAVEQQMTAVRNDAMSPIFMAVIEATEEAIINSLFAASDMTGNENHEIKKLPVEKVLEIMKNYRAVSEN